tara:strand:+ start:633 stop:1322 length:690 start_codon:yes stop_codon:yes gene_type:complete
MKIETALILCAGYGKRLNPLTLQTPKPLLKLKNLSMLEHAINFVEKLGIKKIKINTFYLESQIIDFISQNSLKEKIEVLSDGKEILGTGGGILNLVNSSDENDFLILNPDTLWNSNYIRLVEEMSDIYFNQRLENILLVVNKKKSYDSRFKGDFGMNKNVLNKKEKLYIYTGCQIMNKMIFDSKIKKNFSISDVWNKKLDENNLYGFESTEKFVHLTDFEIYNKLLKNY